MRFPEAPPATAASLRVDRRRLALALVAVPVLIGLGVWLGGHFAGTASRLHPNVSLAERYLQVKDAPSKTGVLTPDELAIERVRQAPRELLLEAARIRSRFEVGSRIFGGWIGLVVAAKLVSLALRRKRTDYEPDRGDCFACARCFEYCPNELVRRGIPLPAATVAALQAAPRALAATGGREPAIGSKKEPVTL
jgi:NAD-dependent dihydropyrimidine dehydrogenase PreA subunit